MRTHPIQVVSKPALLYFIKQPPLVVHVGEIFQVAVQATIASGAAMPNVTATAVPARCSFGSFVDGGRGRYTLPPTTYTSLIVVL